MNDAELNGLREQIETLSSFLAHRGWTEVAVPRIGKRLAAVINDLLSDVGDAKGKSDLLRGQAAAYQHVLKMFRADLDSLKHQLEEALKEGPSEEAARASDIALPPV